VIISRSRFVHNRVLNGSGGAIHLTSSPVALTNSEFYNNSALSGGGGGISWSSQSRTFNPSYLNVSFKENVALFGPDYASDPFYL